MDKDRSMGFRCVKVQFCVECSNTCLFFKILISFNFMNFFIIKNSVLKNTFLYVFIFYNNLEINFQNYIAVIAQDTQIFDGLSTAITNENEL